MSFIVCKGLGGAHSITDGYGDDSAMPEIDRAVIQFETGNLRIEVQRFDLGAMVIFDDGDNYINRYFPLTAEQLAGTAWMIVNVSRIGNTLGLAIDKSEVQTAALATPIKSYGGKVTVMQYKKGGIFDVRSFPKGAVAKQIEYYINDIEENEGKALLP
jgi:hypothetical protein